MSVDPYPRDKRLILTEEDIKILRAALLKASGGVPQANPSKILWDKLFFYNTILSKKNSLKGKTKNIIRIFFMENRSMKINEEPVRDDTSIKYNLKKDLGGKPEDCSNYKFCKMAYRGCQRIDDKCPDYITLKEVKEFTDRKLITKGKNKGKTMPSKFEKSLEKFIKRGK